jgi:hypothetical protein
VGSVSQAQKQKQQQQSSFIDTVQVGHTASKPALTLGSSTGGSTSSSIADPEHQGESQPSVEQQEQQQQQRGPTASIDTRDPDAAVAAITAAIAADMGEPLATGPRAKPQLFIGDLLVGPNGALLPTAEQQLAVLSGLFQQCAGDLLEIYGYYALLGGSAQVVADRWAWHTCMSWQLMRVVQTFGTRFAPVCCVAVLRQCGMQSE